MPVCPGCACGICDRRRNVCLDPDVLHPQPDALQPNPDALQPQPEATPEKINEEKQNVTEKMASDTDDSSDIEAKTQQKMTDKSNASKISKIEATMQQKLTDKSRAFLLVTTAAGRVADEAAPPSSAAASDSRPRPRRSRPDAPIGTWTYETAVLARQLLLSVPPAGVATDQEVADLSDEDLANAVRHFRQHVESTIQAARPSAPSAAAPASWPTQADLDLDWQAYVTDVKQQWQQQQQLAAAAKRTAAAAAAAAARLTD
jgi:hypothetical protein